MDYQNLSDGEIMFNRMTERYRSIRERQAEMERGRNARERLNRLRDIRSGQIIEEPRLNYIRTREEEFMPNILNRERNNILNSDNRGINANYIRNDYSDAANRERERERQRGLQRELQRERGLQREREQRREREREIIREKASKKHRERAMDSMFDDTRQGFQQQEQQTRQVEEITSRLEAQIAQIREKNRLGLLNPKLNEIKRRLSLYNSNEIPNEFKCPITLEIMIDPVITADGHTFERAPIKMWLNNGRNLVSPKTNLPLPNGNLIPNIALRSRIQDWISGYNKDMEGGGFDF